MQFAVITHCVITYKYLPLDGHVTARCRLLLTSSTLIHVCAVPPCRRCYPTPPAKPTAIDYMQATAYSLNVAVTPQACGSATIGMSHGPSGC